MTLSEAVKKPYVATALAVFAGLIAYRFLDLLWLAGLIAVVVLVIQKPERVKRAYEWLWKQIDIYGG